MNITEAKALVLQECQREKKITIRNLVVVAVLVLIVVILVVLYALPFVTQFASNLASSANENQPFYYKLIGDSNVVILSCDAHLDCIQ